jgi:hypothetical protein
LSSDCLAESAAKNVMGSQIQIAQLEDDEIEMASALRGKYAVLAVPRFSSNRTLHPVPVGECDASKQKLFLAEHRELILAHVVPVLGTTAEQYHVDPVACRALLIEWNRTEKDGRLRRYGRLYYSGKGHPDSENTARVMAYLRRYLMRTCPLRSTDAHKICVGPALAQKLEQGLLELVYANSTRIPLAPAKAT